VIEELEDTGTSAQGRAYTHNVGYSERSHVPVEPRLSDQWFLRYPSVDRSTAAVEQGADPLLPRTLGQDLHALDAEPQGLVHLAPALVGPPDPGVVPQTGPGSNRTPPADVD
jgi:valyl-tRNA synthetase